MGAAVVGALAALGAAFAPANAAGSAAAPDGVVAAVSGRAAGATADVATAAYWTPARMAAARPAAVPTADPAAAPASTAAAVAQRGAPGGAPPGLPTADRTVTSASASLDADVATLLAGSRALLSVGRPYTNLPKRTSGKVFFHDPRTGGDYVCSATSVFAENRSVVWTAGHCVAGKGYFMTRWVFVPAYNSAGRGDAPYGIWSSRMLATTNAWLNTNNNAFDMGVALVAPRSGRRLAEVVGGQGIAWNRSPSQSFVDLGYPSRAPFDGRSMFACTGSTARIDTRYPSPRPIGLVCAMTQGSSGGGWHINLAASGLGYVNGLNSYKYNADQTTMYSPYFGSAAQSLYNFVRSR